VAGEKGGKKLEQAEKLGVRIIATEEFLQMVNKFRR
jgi:NAD-dependent DNA ligase